MEICGQGQENRHCSVEISRLTCTAEYKTKESCGCEFIKPVSGFECHLCRVFIRNGNGIEGHISLLQHKTFYQIHLQSHNQDQNCLNHDQTNVNTESRDDLTSNQNHCIIKGFATARNFFQGNLVYDGNRERKCYSAVTDTDNVTKDQFDDSDSDQRASDPSRVCKSFLEKEREGTFECRQMKIEDTNVDSIDLDEGVSFTQLHTGRNYPCDVSKTSLQGEQEGVNKALKIKQEDGNGDYNDFHDDDQDNEGGIIGVFSDDSDSESVSLANKALKIKKEDDDDDYNDFHEDDHDNEDGVIGGFLDDSDGESVNLDDNYDGELMPGYEIVSSLKTESSGQEIYQVSSSGASSTSIVEETCTSTAPSSGKQLPESFSENREKHGISETSKADNCESISGEELSPNSETVVRMDINTCDDTQFLEKGSDEGHRAKDIRGGPFSCDVCGKSFNLTVLLKDHECVHAGEKQNSFDPVGIDSGKLNDYKRHEIMHGGERPFLCHLCGKSFRQKAGLQIHERTHTGERPFSCNMCGKSFKQCSNLKTHERIHTEEKPFSCDDCGMKFTRSNRCKQHKLVHTGERPFLCNLCRKSFNRKSTLRIHERIHTGEEPFSCNVCGKSFKQGSNLKTHERMHSREMSYSCDECEMTFSRLSTYKHHKKVHTGEKPFLCNFCGKSFKQSFNLKMHKRKHTGEKPFTCDDCGMKFARKSNFKRHRMIHTCEDTVVV